MIAEDEPSTPRQKAAPMSFRMSRLFQTELSQGQTQSLDSDVRTLDVVQTCSAFPIYYFHPLKLSEINDKATRKETLNGITNMPAG